MLTNHNHAGEIVFRLLLAGLFVLALGSVGGSIPASAEPQAQPLLAPVAGGPGYVMVPAIAFVAESSTAAYTVFWGELSVPESAPGGLTSFNAPLYLPQGAHLTGIIMYYRDTVNDTKTLGVDLMRRPLPSASSGENVGLSVYGNQIGFNVYQSDTTVSPGAEVVDNSQYSYWLKLYIWGAPSYLQLQAIRVDYSFNVGMPFIQR